MTAIEGLAESDVLRNLRQVSEARGLKLYFDPPREIVPEFLGDFRPDALAVGPEGGVVIEFMARGRSPRHLSEVAKRVSGAKGWEFRAILLNPSNDQMPVIGKPAPEQIEALLQEIQALTARGHRAAALVMAFAALESLARLTIMDGERSSAFATPLAAIQRLAEQGYLENEDADLLRDLAKVRNLIVHGDASVDVQTNQIDGVLRTLRQVATDIVTN